ncbi:MAG: peptidase S41 [Lachnospiraceae bacterium]|nr:peptidase S41 [Lachnospiraceae bacterium]
MEYMDIFLIVLEMLGAVLLFWLAGYAQKVVNSKWRIAYALPAVICLGVAGFAGFEVHMLGVYLGAVSLLGGFLWEGQKIRRMVSALAAVLILLSLPICLFSSGYRTTDYVQDFKEGFAAMKEHYVLGEHKQIDWDELYARYLPEFEAANRAHDDVANYIAWESFCQEFYDGHVSFTAKHESSETAAHEQIFGNDYGLSLMKLADGRTVAVNVQTEGVIADAGIHNGTVITQWNGRTIEEIAGELEVALMSFPDKDNEAFYSALLVAGTGDDKVVITYLDDEGTSCTVEAPKLGAYYERLKETVDTIDQGVQAGNLEWKEINEDTYALRIKGMMYDTDSMKSRDHSAMQSELREKLLAIREEGVTKLVIDLRSNGGGSGDMVMALAELFAPEGEHYYVTDPVWDEENHCYKRDPETGGYLLGTEYTYQGEGLWGDGPIVMLVNAQSASAADHFTKIMRGMENITIMGFTEPNGSAQGVQGVELESGTLSLSAQLLLDRNGDVFIDSGIDRESGDDVDLIIPFDEEAVRALFDEGQDYVLEKALEYMK